MGALNWNLMNVLFEKGWRGNPVSKAKSVLLTEKGKRLARAFLVKHGSRSQGPLVVINNVAGSKGAWQSKPHGLSVLSPGEVSRDDLLTHCLPSVRSSPKGIVTRRLK